MQSRVGPPGSIGAMVEGKAPRLGKETEGARSPTSALCPLPSAFRRSPHPVAYYQRQVAKRLRGRAEIGDRPQRRLHPLLPHLPPPPPTRHLPAPHPLTF